MNALTTRQQQVLGFIQGKQDSQGLTPTLREIAAHFRFSSPNAALAHVQALREKGFLKSLPGRARTLQVVGPNTPKGRRPRVVSVPIYGAIPAGLPADAAQEEEGCVLIDVDTLGIKPTARTFGLKVRGDSMIGKHIVDGDVAIIEHGLAPHPGDVVAALIDGPQACPPLRRAASPAHVHQAALLPRLPPRYPPRAASLRAARVRTAHARRACAAGWGSGR